MNDPMFYIRVLENEEPGQLGNEFKMHIFKATPEAPEFNQEFELQMVDILNDLGGDKYQFAGMSPDKLRVNFWVADKQKSIDIYKHF